jgi:hypothetical protein
MFRKPNLAEKRYLARFMPCMIAYMAFEAILFRDAHPQGLLAYAMAIAPALAIIGVIVAMSLYLVDEMDEYLRVQHARSVIVATGLTLSVATVWGFLEDYGLAPHVQAYWGFVVFMGMLGLARCLIKLGDRA